MVMLGGDGDVGGDGVGGDGVGGDVGGDGDVVTTVYLGLTRARCLFAPEVTRARCRCKEIILY